MAIVNWSEHLDFVRDHVGLDEQWGVLHQGAAVLTWVDSVDADGPVFRVDVDHPGEFSLTPTRQDDLPDFDHRYVVDGSGVRVPNAQIWAYAKVGGIWTTYPVTERVWAAGDLAILVVVASEAALDEMITPSERKHLPLMRVYCDAEQGPDAAFNPNEPFTAAEVGIISTWFGDLGTNGNPKYPSGLTPAQVATFFGQYYPQITSAAQMATYMQNNPRSNSIGAFGQIFEYAP